MVWKKFLCQDNQHVSCFCYEPQSFKPLKLKIVEINKDILNKYQTTETFFFVTQSLEFDPNKCGGKWSL